MKNKEILLEEKLIGRLKHQRPKHHDEILLTESIMQRIQQQKTEKKHIFSLAWVRKISAVAAVLLLVFFVALKMEELSVTSSPPNDVFTEITITPLDGQCVQEAENFTDVYNCYSGRKSNIKNIIKESGYESKF